MVKPGFEKQALSAMRDAQNFLKRADQEPDRVLDFWLGHPEMLLGAARDKYRELAAEQRVSRGRKMGRLGRLRQSPSALDRRS